MRYTIHVRKKHQRFISTTEGTIQSLDKLNRVYSQLRNKFPEEEGYTFCVIEEDKGRISVIKPTLTKFSRTTSYIFVGAR